MTHQIFLLHAVDVWSDDGEVLDALRGARVGNVDDHLRLLPSFLVNLDVVSNSAEATLQGTGQGALRQVEGKRELVQTARKNRRHLVLLVLV